MLIEKGNKRFYKIIFDREEFQTDVIIYNKERKLIVCIRILFIGMFLKILIFRVYYFQIP